ncbi:MAG: serine acetyltransferase, partial [Bacteroidales bacterium]|nr:serine acetyltransferase [Bacteroidales bacterium]
MKPEGDLIIKARKSFAEDIGRVNKSYGSGMPSMKETQRWVKDLVNLLFPIKLDRHINIPDIEAGIEKLHMRLVDLMIPMKNELPRSPDDIAVSFFNKLPEIFNLLTKDASTFVKSDPAAEKLEEVILCYPGFFGLMVYRIAHILYQLKVPVIPRVMTEYAHSKTGIDIHPGADRKS